MAQQTTTSTRSAPRDGEWTARDLRLLSSNRNRYEVIGGCLAVIYGNELAHLGAVWSLARLLSPFVCEAELEIVLGPLPYRFADDCEVLTYIVVVPRSGRALGEHSLSTAIAEHTARKRQN
jgi:hypothetical protein